MCSIDSGRQCCRQRRPIGSVVGASVWVVIYAVIGKAEGGGGGSGSVCALSTVVDGAVVSVDRSAVSSGFQFHCLTVLRLAEWKVTMMVVAVCVLCRQWSTVPSSASTDRQCRWGFSFTACVALGGVEGDDGGGGSVCALSTVVDGADVDSRCDSNRDRMRKRQSHVAWPIQTPTPPTPTPTRLRQTYDATLTPTDGATPTDTDYCDRDRTELTGGHRCDWQRQSEIDTETD